jgi:branched-chain amino acid transport system ATP-binding protein
VQREIFTRIDEISGGGVTVLLAEQNANLALGVANEGHLIAGGRVQLSAPATELRRSDAVRRSYLGD